MSNKVMIVSGGASGLGLAAAEKFAKNGYNIVLIDIDETKGKKAEEKEWVWMQYSAFVIFQTKNR